MRLRPETEGTAEAAPAAVGSPRTEFGEGFRARPGHTRRAGGRLAPRPVRRHLPQGRAQQRRGGAQRPRAHPRLPPHGVWPLSILAVAALCLLTRGRTVRQGAWLGFAFGLPFFFWLLDWLRTVGWDAVAGLSVIEALYLAGLGACLVLSQKLPCWPVWAACLWVTEELVRDRVPFGGFPWGRLAFANTSSPYTPLAALGGAPWSPSRWPSAALCWPRPSSPP